MRRYYLSRIIGSGKHDDPFRAEVADYGDSYGMIKLHTAPVKAGDMAFAMVDSPVAVNTARSQLLTDNLIEKSMQMRKAVESKLGITLVDEKLPDILAEALFFAPRLSAWKPLRPSRDGKLRIFLGGQVWGPPKPKYLKGTISDDFSGDLSLWTIVDGNWAITDPGDELESIGGGTSFGFIRHDTGVGSADHYSEIKLTFVTANTRTMGAAVRFAAAAETCYMGVVGYVGLARIYEITAGGEAVLSSSARAIATPIVVKLEVDGSNLEVFEDDVSRETASDASIAGNEQVGLVASSLSAQRGDLFEAGGLGVAHEKSLSDTVAVADSVRKYFGVVQADSVALADAVSKGPGLIQADSIAVADALVKAVGLTKSDSVAIADDVSKASGQVQADTITIADAISKEPGLIQADTMTLADALTKTVGLFKADTVTIADTFSRIVTFIRAYTDTVAIADAIRKRVSIVKADTMTIADSIVTALGLTHLLNLADTIAIADSIAGIIRIKTYVRVAISRMNVVRLGVSRMPLWRYITRRFP